MAPPRAPPQPAKLPPPHRSVAVAPPQALPNAPTPPDIAAAAAAAAAAAGGSNKLLASLNPAQRRAVTSAANTVAILAGPGSGKTHTLASRVAWIIDRTGYRPEDVVVATFTVKAAREMKDRIGKALGGECERRIVLGTFHSIARRYLAAYGKHVGLNPKFSIADDGDSRAIVQRICKRMQTNVEPSHARSWISKKKAKGSDQQQQQQQQQQLQRQAAAKGPSAASQKMTETNRDLETIYADYQAQLELSNLLDYDDLLVKCAELLREHPPCVANIQAVLIDEYQDTNGIQYELMKLLAQARQRITVVGDPDQSIYGWRSAEVRNLYRLLREFPETEEVALEENYRSSQAILAMSLAVIQQDQKRYQKVLRPVHNRGSRPVLRKLRTASNEGEWIVAEIGRIMRMTGGLLNLRDVAILLRSASLSRHVESALGKSGIAYRMVGGFKFYDRVEVKMVLDYLRVIHQPDNNDAVARILNVPRRGIGDTTAKNLLEEAEHARLSLWTLLVKHCRGDRAAKTSIKKLVEQKLSGELIKTINAARRKVEDATRAAAAEYDLVDVIRQLLTQLKLQQYLQDNYPEDHEQRWLNVQEFLALAGDFARDLQASQAFETLPPVDGITQTVDADLLGKFLANVSLASDAQTGGNDDGQDKSSVVTISTIHAAKGLEWPVVFVPAVFAGSIPHSRAEDLDEERRLLYVAMTRAKAVLYLSWPMFPSAQSSTGGQKAELSPFLPPDIAKRFAQKGPLLEKPLVQQIGRILGREVPRQADIYNNMALMVGVDDDLFPIDPETRKRDADGGAAGGAAGAEYSGQQPKRQRTTYGNDRTARTDVEILGQKGYVTTMDQASKFTMASLPGFTTAGAHRTAMATAAAAVAEVAVPMPRRSEPLNAASSRTNSKPKAVSKALKPAGDQKMLLGFLKKEPGASTRIPSTSLSASTALAREGQPQRTASWPANKPSTTNNTSADTRTAVPTIDPSLTKHHLARGQLLPRPAPRPTPTPSAPGATATANTKMQDDGPRKQYAFLSSSPTRPDPANDARGGLVPSSPMESTRPAACLHATSSTLHSVGMRARYLRPQGLQMGGGLTPVEKLQKPFKPLTINR